MDHTIVKEKKPSFQVKDGSNYRVIMTYDKQEIISFEHFKALANALFKSDATFVTVNDIIVQVKDIRMIEPTDSLTEDQKQIREKEYQLYLTKQKRIDDLKDLSANHAQDCLVGLVGGSDKWFGMTYWERCQFRFQPEITNQIQEDFKKKHPSEWQELEEYYRQGNNK